jgi:phosphatidylglycerophosphatase A
MSNIIKLMASTCWGLGLLPKAPGTWGSLFPLAVVLGCGQFGFVYPWLHIILLCLCAASSLATISLFPFYSKHFGKNDPPQVVSDEVAGQSIALLAMAWIVPETDVSVPVWIGLAAFAFVLFRFFDIVKLGIIERAQSLPHGWGVLMDDILAGMVAGGFILLAIQFI